MSAKKAWVIDLDKINEGYCYDTFVAYAEKRNKAKSLLLKDAETEGMTTNDEEVTCLNIPIKRAKELDKYLYNGEYLTNHEIKLMKIKEERNELWEDIKLNTGVSYCYIMKRGSYYRPNRKGYTSFLEKAGVYDKYDAISQAKSCEDLEIIPIVIKDHNSCIRGKIKELLSKIIYNG